MIFAVEAKNPLKVIQIFFSTRILCGSPFSVFFLTQWHLFLKLLLKIVGSFSHASNKNHNNGEKRSKFLPSAVFLVFNRLVVSLATLGKRKRRQQTLESILRLTLISTLRCTYYNVSAEVEHMFFYCIVVALSLGVLATFFWCTSYTYHLCTQMFVFLLFFFFVATFTSLPRRCLVRKVLKSNTSISSALLLLLCAVRSRKSLQCVWVFSGCVARWAPPDSLLTVRIFIRWSA